MRLSSTLVLMGAALVVSTTAARAQESLAERAATAAEVPWHERFTFSAGQEQAPEWSSLNPRAPGGGAATGRWGLTVNVGEAERAERAGPPSDRTAIGAYYRFTPHVRLGGGLSVTEEPSSVGPNEADRTGTTKAGVRLESAFRF